MQGARVGKGVAAWHSRILGVGGQLDTILGKSVRRSVIKGSKKMQAF